MTAEPTKTHDFRVMARMLRRGPFARYILGEAVSVTGAWMQMFAQGWLLTTLTDRAWVFGAIGRPDAQEYLAPLLKDADPDVRLSAATALLELKAS